MMNVDPTIEVGAVGVTDPEGWSDWGNEVISGTRGALDFYVIHHYGYSSSPDDEEALQQPESIWPDLLEMSRGTLDSDVALAVTEYNLVSFLEGDTEAKMTTAMNALYIADTIGQLAVGGVRIANQWNLANGSNETGADYGMVHIDDWERTPQLDALAAWSRMGETLLPVEGGEGGLSPYASRHDGGRVTVLVINLTDSAISRTLAVSGVDEAATASITTTSADDLADREMATRVGGSLGPADRLLSVDLPRWSINTIDIDTGS
jgi:hypothetical protein